MPSEILHSNALKSEPKSEFSRYNGIGYADEFAPRALMNLDETVVATGAGAIS